MDESITRADDEIDLLDDEGDALMNSENPAELADLGRDGDLSVASDSPAVEYAVDRAERGQEEVSAVEAHEDDWSEEQLPDDGDEEELSANEVDDAGADWGDTGEPRTEILVETAIAIGAAGLNIFGQLASAAWRMAAGTGTGRFLGDVASGVRNAAVKEGEPYIETAGRWSQEQLARLVAAVTPAVMETIDVTDLAERLDLDALLARIDTDALLERVDLERLVERVNVRALLESVDMDSLVLKVDLNPRLNDDDS